MVIRIMSNRKDEKIKYKVFSIRLHEETKKKFIEERKRSGLSWNLFLLELLKRNGKHRPR